MIFTIVNARYISIHVLREEGDRAGVGQVAMESQFLSTSSARRATVPQPAEMRGLKQFLSTSSARRATTARMTEKGGSDISIHVLREEGDAVLYEFCYQQQHISIHVLREEGDKLLRLLLRRLRRFLSTSSARRATPRSIMRLQVRYNFYPRPPRGGRRRLCGHRDGGAGFLSTSSARRATQRYGDRILWQYISIHVLREEGDTENSAHANQYG